MINLNLARYTMALYSTKMIGFEDSAVIIRHLQKDYDDSGIKKIISVLNHVCHKGRLCKEEYTQLTSVSVLFVNHMFLDALASEEIIKTDVFLSWFYERVVKKGQLS